MRIRMIGLVAATATLAAACGPAPGSAEWCKGIADGTIQPSQEEAMQHGPACAQQMLKDLMGTMQLPSQ
jgi:hypothetical protein